MSGNVWEWVWDRFGDYPGDVVDWYGPATGAYRACQGGSWNYCPDYCRSAARGKAGPVNVGSHLGFRLVRSLL